MGTYDEVVMAGFERACEKYPDKTAIIYLGERFSYRRLKDLIHRFATVLPILCQDTNFRSELIRWCKERLAPYKAPQYIEFRDMLPKSKVGKLLRREVREEERRRLEKDKRPIRV